MMLENAIGITIGILLLFVAGYYFFAKKPVSIYNQDQPPRVEALTDVRLYNQTTALLMFIYGMIFIGEGLFIDQRLLCMVSVILTVMPGLVIVIVIYETVILKHFLKK